jgi:hypothetical protein
MLGSQNLDSHYKNKIKLDSQNVGVFLIEI